MFVRNYVVRALMLTGTLSAFVLFAPAAQAQSTKQLQQEINAMQATITLQGQKISTLQTTVTSQGQQITTLTTALSSAQASLSTFNGILHFFSVSGQNIIITGANLQLENGMGDTHQKNGLGNLILGYENVTNILGSHNLVSGDGNSVSGCGSIVTGFQNYASGNDGLVAGGSNNTVYGNSSLCLGGDTNVVIPNSAGAVLGSHNTVSDLGTHGLAMGGSNNQVAGNFGLIMNGDSNSIGSTVNATIIGGGNNLADGGQGYSVICAGFQNHMDGGYDSFIGGGGSNHVSNFWGGTVGGFQNTLTPTADYAVAVAGSSHSVSTIEWLQAAGTAVSP